MKFSEFERENGNLMKFQKFVNFFPWKSAISCLESHPKMLSIPPKIVPVCCPKPGDSFRYPQNDFWTPGSPYKDTYKKVEIPGFWTALSPLQYWILSTIFNWKSFFLKLFIKLFLAYDKFWILLSHWKNIAIKQISESVERNRTKIDFWTD